MDYRNVASPATAPLYSDDPSIGQRDASQIGTQVTAVVNGLTSVEAALAQLVERISPALRPEGPEAAVSGGPAAQPRPVVAPLADCLRSFADQLTVLRTHIDRVTKRVEL